MEGHYDLRNPLDIGKQASKQFKPYPRSSCVFHINSVNVLPCVRGVYLSEHSCTAVFPTRLFNDSSKLIRWQRSTVTHFHTEENGHILYMYIQLYRKLLGLSHMKPSGFHLMQVYFVG